MPCAMMTTTTSFMTFIAWLNTNPASHSPHTQYFFPSIESTRTSIFLLFETGRRHNIRRYPASAAKAYLKLSQRPCRSRATVPGLPSCLHSHRYLQASSCCLPFLTFVTHLRHHEYRRHPRLQRANAASRPTERKKFGSHQAEEAHGGRRQQELGRPRAAVLLHHYWIAG
jgi:hypothetical protein